MTPSSPDRYERLTPVETALSVPLGSMPRSPLPRVTEPARAALERAVVGALRAPVCHVLFSGGRDSSLVLAVATHVARRDGYPDPVPVTAVYPDAPESDESEWQRLVLDHLAIKDRIIVRITDQRSLLGDASLSYLRRRGLVWPAAVQSQPVLLDRLDVGSVLTGEAGDGVIAPTRGTPLHLLREDRRPTRAHLRAAAHALEPSVVARHRLRADAAWRTAAPWLTPRARRALEDATVDSRGPLRWDAAKWRLLSRRSTHYALHNTVAGAADLGLTMVHPLADPGFVVAVAREGGRGGFRGRTHVFRHLAADLLPDAVLARSTKARFNASRWGDRERDFAAAWDGAGMDPDLIDAEALRREWLSESPSPASTFLVHAAWLAAHGSGATRSRSEAGLA